MINERRNRRRRSADNENCPMTNEQAENIVARIEDIERMLESNQAMQKKVDEMHDTLTRAGGFIAGGRFVFAMLAVAAGTAAALIYELVSGKVSIRDLLG
jgi:acyl-coenzyme A thioesterase PaaI-like protein